MGNHLIAKNRMKALTSRIEKDIYILDYGNDTYTDLNDDLFIYVHSICLDKDQFPLIRYNGEIYINGSAPKLYSTLLHLAADYGIILDYRKII